MTYDFHIKRPMQLVQLKLKMILDENPHPINVLDMNVLYH